MSRYLFNFQKRLRCLERHCHNGETSDAKVASLCIKVGIFFSCQPISSCFNIFKQILKRRFSSGETVNVLCYIYENTLQQEEIVIKMGYN